ncbi:hypothetical protein MC7420_1753 [Coleofasciculus chthonoplastes PCC 7420]|uniref:Uncharacterized protein n=1 Tax=Coleofasciculus chthonoplastes PCC 7420 TaxID=118168 RepID=B4VML5_9CYAN|nr:hypothetical protein MC7420_1753 [Coleofasciculus chthonoplastes PCC 7420]
MRVGFRSSTQPTGVAHLNGLIGIVGAHRRAPGLTLRLRSGLTVKFIPQF